MGYTIRELLLAYVSMATYDSLHRQCRTLESLFDTKLTSYARLASTISRSNDLESGALDERWNDIEIEVEDLLQKAKNFFEQLSYSRLIILISARGNKRAVRCPCK